MKLSEAERANIAACLLASLPPADHERWSAEWEQEIARRLQTTDDNSARLATWEEARQRIFTNG